MPRITEYVGRAAILYHLAILHHGNEVADLRGDAQIMGDEDDLNRGELHAFWCKSGNSTIRGRDESRPSASLKTALSKVERPLI